jgi:2-C-methyl-D-erythritol 4-phosphate cytidylyltransferase
MNCGIIVAAAGQGRRLGLKQNKILVELARRPMLIYSVECFVEFAWAKEIVVVVHELEVELIEQLLRVHNLGQVKVVPGGSERQHSIKNGLEVITSEYVMVHDAARPFISKQLIGRIYDRLMDIDAVIPGTPVVETIKMVDGYQRVYETLNRDQLWSIQTPQAFRRTLLVEAYKRAEADKFLGTDDASLVERLGVDVEVVMGDYRNLKVTTADDLLHAEVILQNWSDMND